MSNILQAEKMEFINVGLKIFGEELQKQGQEVALVDWKPVAGGRKEIVEALDRIEPVRDKIAEANRQVISRIKNAKPMLIGMDLAIHAIPGMKDHLILHAGPVISWEKMCGPMKGAVIGAVLYEEMAKTPEEAVELEARQFDFLPVGDLPEEDPAVKKLGEFFAQGHFADAADVAQGLLAGHHGEIALIALLGHGGAHRPDDPGGAQNVICMAVGDKHAANVRDFDTQLVQPD